MSQLELRGVSKLFGGVRAVDGVALEADSGNVTALIGPNGAGKTTLFNLISGLFSPDEGEIYYRGMNVTGLSPWRIARMGVGRLFQDVRVFRMMTVRDNILAAFKDQKGESVLRSIFARRKVMAEEKHLLDRTEELLELVELSGTGDELAGNLSYGQQKLLAIARLLAADAEAILLDEPSGGVSPHMIETLFKQIRRLATEGRAILIIEHDMELVSRIAERVYFMANGRVICHGESKDVLTQPEVKVAYLGI